MTRSILVTEIFDRATKARIGTGDDSAALTLMSTDMERIRVGFRNLNDLWTAPLEASLAAWMLYNRLGIIFLAAIGIVIACFICLAILISFTGDSQRAWMTGVQRRTGLTATVIASMKNLRISGLTGSVSNFIQMLRVEELAAGARYRKIFIMAATLGFLPLLLGPPLTFAFTRETLDASTMFTCLAFLTLLCHPLSQLFGSVPQIVSGIACLGRIQAFLMCETNEDYRQFLSDMRRSAEKAPTGDEDSPDAIIIKDGKFGWEEGKFVLQNVSARIPKASLTMVVGPVGSGKSTLCKALLGEMPFGQGSVVLRNRAAHVGFCEQTAFLSNETVRNNITGFSSFASERYAEVVNATALVLDFAALPLGDQTNVGSDGITLSGGQKQRISLARALYLQTDLFVFDDVFSGLDADTEEQVFRQVFGPGGLLRRRHSTVVLCTHSVKHLPAADYIMVLDEGTIAQQGSFRELRNRQGYVQGLELSSSPDRDTSPDIGIEASKAATSGPSVHTSKGPLPRTMPDDTSSLENEGDKARQVGDKTVYKHYVKSMGFFLAGLGLFFASCWGFLTNFPTVWLTYWTEDVYSEHPTRSYGFYAGIYAMLQVSAAISLLLLGITLWVYAVKKAGANIHQEALTTLTRAPLSFFTNTDTGVVTNLFSQDLNLVDTELPEATLNTLFCIFQALGQAAVMLVSSVYLAIAYPFLGAVLYAVARFYLRTSRQLRLLDLEAKSPLYTHFLDTVKGIVTIRAFGFLQDDIRKNARLLNTSQRPAYLLLMIQEWLNLVLALVVMVLAVILVTLSIQLHSKSAFAGASLYSLITLGENLVGIVLFYTRLETSIGAIARLKAFNESVKPEDREEEDVVPPEGWPQNGVVELKGVSAGYG
jgi:ABC-type multidrug transport system fused ATPase/permease subunit